MNYIGPLVNYKYFLVFNHDQKYLAFYQNYENKDPDNDDNNNDNNFIYNIVYIVIGITVLILIGIFIICLVQVLKNKRKLRANELEDDYLYDSEKKNKLNDNDINKDKIDYFPDEDSLNTISRNNSESKID